MDASIITRCRPKLQADGHSPRCLTISIFHRVVSPNRVYHCLYRIPPAVCAALALHPLVTLYLNATREMISIERDGKRDRERERFIPYFVCRSLRLLYPLLVAFFHRFLSWSVFFYSATKVVRTSISANDSSQVLFALRKNLKFRQKKDFRACSSLSPCVLWHLHLCVEDIKKRL